jgi:hypothetical protein
MRQQRVGVVDIDGIHPAHGRARRPRWPDTAAAWTARHTPEGSTKTGKLADGGATATISMRYSWLLNRLNSAPRKRSPYTAPHARLKAMHQCIPYTRLVEASDGTTSSTAICTVRAKAA